MIKILEFADETQKAAAVEMAEGLNAINKDEVFIVVGNALFTSLQDPELLFKAGCIFQVNLDISKSWSSL